MMLGEKANSQTRVLGYKADRRLQLANEEFEDGRFARAVGADNADTGVELDVEVYIFEEGFSGRVAEGDTGHLYDRWRELLHIGKLEVNCVLAFWGFQYGHLLKFLDPGLGFG